MAEEERQNKELLYGRISDEVVSVISRFPDVQIVPPDGFQSLMNGISQVWRKKGVPGIMIHTGKDGIIVDVSVSISCGCAPVKLGKSVQKALAEAMGQSFSVPISAINIDILKLVK